MKNIPVLIFGVGGVGVELLTQIMNSRLVVAERNKLHFDVVGLLDSRSLLWQPEGLSDEEINAGIQAKQAAVQQLTPPTEKSRATALSRAKTRRALQAGHILPLGEIRPGDAALLAKIAAAALKNLIVVDVTAADGMEPLLSQSLRRGYGVVLANKKPMAAPWETAQPFYHHPNLRHESTVGGGQPIITTMRYFLDTADPISQIEGQMSGTLGFICNQLDEGIPFSQALQTAKDKGFTEPDPREDLGGMDVMRKVLILGRMAGWPLETADISVESLYPTALAHLSAAEFMQAAKAIDPSMQDRMNKAAKRGMVLRYIGRVDENGGTVGLQEVPASSPVAALKYIRFTTGNYDDEPLLIAGKGAGVEMTASGVLGDMIDLARQMG